MFARKAGLFFNNLKLPAENFHGREWALNYPSEPLRIFCGLLAMLYQMLEN
jgi:hypothetical protein